MFAGRFIYMHMYIQYTLYIYVTYYDASKKKNNGLYVNCLYSSNSTLNKIFLRQNQVILKINCFTFKNETDSTLIEIKSKHKCNRDFTFKQMILL